MDTPTEILFWQIAIGIGVCSVIVGAVIGNSRGRPGAGALLAFFLGPLGCIIALFLPKEGRRCPYCKGVIHDQALRCEHCTSDLTPFTVPRS